ncbi:MAG: hypothetical protein WBY77_02960 [Pseudolabrys sp.]
MATDIDVTPTTHKSASTKLVAPLLGVFIFLSLRCRRSAGFTHGNENVVRTLAGMLQEKTSNEFVFFGEPFCAVPRKSREPQSKSPRVSKFFRRAAEVEAKATGQDLAKIVFFGSGDTTAEADFSRCFIAWF